MSQDTPIIISSMSANHEQTVPLEQMSTVELTMWLQSKGFGANVQSAFEGNLY